MRAESNIMPQQPYLIDARGEFSDITFFNNIKEAEDGEGWAYDTYTLTVESRPDLDSIVEESYDEWLAYAMEEEAYKEDEKPTEVEKLKQEDLNNKEAIAELYILMMGGY